MAENLHTCPMPHGSKGRVALANGKIMGKAFATPKAHGTRRARKAVDNYLQ